MDGYCHLCKEFKILQRKNHVIPEFFYRVNNLFESNNKILKYDLRTYIKDKRKIILSEQMSGEYDQYKLCETCDRKIIGNYESYTREFFYSKNLRERRRLDLTFENDFIECTNSDYKKIKLLFLSILWRANISERPFFNHVKLDDKTNEALRLMIRDGDPKTDLEFPVIFMDNMLDNTISSKYLLQPIQMKVGEENGFLFCIGGMLIIITLGIKTIPETFLSYRIKENGTFKSMHIPYGETIELIKKWYK